MNRIAIYLNQDGEIQQISSDTPVEIFFVDPDIPIDRVYRYESTIIGPEFVQEQISGHATGHAGGRPALRLVHNAAEATEPNITSAGTHPDLP